ncbi:zf-HC2 domain-containing protein [Nocardioides sp. GY 10127]|uniref:zf-HC2 domain-containing protein n=1 Tax=Nocardioides sp. GY 10127 TaxID=2569762 RepID=UPI0010A90F5E|nr:zf-HC2 domain-containing protein [Nocardioides sp. GY 10127]TIC81787.1 anti-sigma factor [Nocardioides sp. GY 10127]
MTDPEEHARLREALGSYVLGHLEQDEAGAVRAHLDGCAECREDVAEIAGLRGPLDRLDADAFERPAVPPPDLGAAIRAQVAAERTAREQRTDDELARARAARRRRGALRVAVAAAVLVAVAGAGVGLGRGTAPETEVAATPTIPWEPVSLRHAGGEDVQVEDAGLVPHTWGVELRITATGFAAGEVYRASFEAEDGTMLPAGEFVGVGEKEMHCNLQSSLLRDDAVRVVVTDAEGRTVLWSRL